MGRSFGGGRVEVRFWAYLKCQLDNQVGMKSKRSDVCCWVIGKIHTEVHI